MDKNSNRYSRVLRILPPGRGGGGGQGGGGGGGSKRQEWRRMIGRARKWNGRMKVLRRRRRKTKRNEKMH